MTIAQDALLGVVRPFDASDCGVKKDDRSGKWIIVWYRDGRLPEMVAGVDFASVRQATDASAWLRRQHGLDR